MYSAILRFFARVIDSIYKCISHRVLGFGLSTIDCYIFYRMLLINVLSTNISYKYLFFQGFRGLDGIKNEIILAKSKTEPESHFFSHFICVRYI